MSDLDKQLADARDAAMASLSDEAKPAGAAGAMPDQPEAKPKPNAVDAPPPDDVVDISYRGKALRIPKAERDKLAEQGYDYASKMQALNEEKRKLREDAKLFDEFGEFRKYMAENPALATAVAKITQEYDEKKVLPRFDYQQGEKVTAMPTLAEQRLAALEQAVGQQIATQRNNRLAQAVRDAVQSRPTFAASPKLAARAEQKLVERLQADPSASVEALAADYETEVQAVLETLPAAKYLQEKKDDAARFGATERPAGLAARQTSPPKAPLTWSDLDSGRVKKMAMDSLLE